MRRYGGKAKIRKARDAPAPVDARPAARSQAPQVSSRAAQGDGLGRRVDAQLELGERGGQSCEPRHEPLRGECGRGRDRERGARGSAHAVDAGATSSTRATRYSDESHAIQAAVAGHGVALLSDALVREELALGALRICPGPVLDGLGYYVLRADDAQPHSGSVERWLVEQANSAR